MNKQYKPELANDLLNHINALYSACDGLFRQIKYTELELKSILERNEVKNDGLCKPDASTSETE